MSERLNRDDAPFQDEVWEKINEAVVGTGNGRLCAGPMPGAHDGFFLTKSPIPRILMPRGICMPKDG